MRRLLILPIALLAGCAIGGGKVVSNGEVTLLSDQKFPAPTALEVVPLSRDYLIGSLDKLNLDVFGIPELGAKELVVDSAGRISVPLAGSIEARAKTPVELEAVIAQGLRRSGVRNPRVSINVAEAASRSVTVSGAVNQAGVYPVLGNMTLQKAIASAQGPTETSYDGNVVVFRTIEGKRYAALYNLRAIRDGHYGDPEIFPNDVVLVSEARAKALFRDALGILPALTYVVVALLN